MENLVFHSWFRSPVTSLDQWRRDCQPQWEPRTCQRLPEDRTPELTYEKGNFYATDAFSDYAVEFIKQGTAMKKPFFLYLAHSSPHFPLHAPAKTRDKYLDR